MSSSIYKSVSSTRGASAIIALGLVMVLMVLAASASSAVVTFMRTTAQVERGSAAYYAAESGVELALLDLASYGPGYETDPDQIVCGEAIDLERTTAMTLSCGETSPYRFVNFANTTTDKILSGARGFWRIFGQAEAERDTDVRVVPNPYLTGDKDGLLEQGELGILGKTQPVAFALAADVHPEQPQLADRYDYLTPDAVSRAALVLMIDPSETVDFSAGTSADQNLAVWTLSAVDSTGQEFTLQGIIREGDFAAECDADGQLVGGGSGTAQCVVLDLLDDSGQPGTDSAHLAGQDINKNIKNDGVIADDAAANAVAQFNRVSGTVQDFHFNRPYDFLAQADESLAGSPWHDVQLSVALIGTLSETSSIDSDQLRYRFIVEPTAPTFAVADPQAYIVAEGFSGNVKQTIEARFRRQATVSIFSYAVFQ